MEIVIRVNGQLALTTVQIAEEFGITPAAARTAVRRAGVAAVAHLDGRTPLYIAEETRAALGARPGRGYRS